jgi:fructoselysine-6-P-deglycase FrlB-like protein
MTQHPGLELMLAQMRSQCPDALSTLDTAGPAAALIAASIRRTNRLVLYAMGGSQHVNRIVEPLYRDLGIDTRALNASEALLSPLPDESRTAIIVSQSGESGEIVELLQRSAGQEERFALTLEGDSTLAKHAVASIVAAGGTEKAFAATRSIVLTIAMHGAILEALGFPQDELRAVLAKDMPADIKAADAALAGSVAYIFAGRHAMAGVAESASLSMMELARVPTIGFEGGQFRHGPFEVLKPGLGIILFRSAGPDAPGVTQLATVPRDAGCKVVLFDASGAGPIDGCTHVSLTLGTGLGAAMSMILTLQNLNIAVARRFIPEGIGTPQRTTKVTA